MRLHVGVAGNNAGWSTLLEQEGVSYSMNVEDLSPVQYSVVILTGRLSSNVRSNVGEYLNAGGALLCSSEVFDELFGQKSRMVFLDYIVPSPASVFFGVGVVDIHRRCNIGSHANEMLTHDGSSCVYIGDFCGGHVVVLPFDAGDVVLDQRTRTKSFYAQRGRIPFEHVSSVAKGALRRLIARSLELLHHRRGLSYVHKWYYPNDAQSVFAFRVDTDGASREEIKSLHDLLSLGKVEKHREMIPATWFVDVKSQEQWLADYGSMEGDEIGIHCYEHKTYDGYQEAHKDINQAINALAKYSLAAKGFAAPYGRWDTGVSEAIEASGFEYSSEFSYDYDNLPSFVSLEGKFLNALQIPVHPISIGSLRRQGFDTTEMTAYFRRVMETKLRAREPLIFYHHPKDGHEQVLESIFAFVAQHGIQAVRMVDFVAWWKGRGGVRLEVDSDHSHLIVKTDTSSETVWLHITRSNGTEGFVPIQPSIDLQTLPWKSCPQSMPLPKDFLKIKKFNPRIPFVRVEDFFYKMFHSH